MALTANLLPADKPTSMNFMMEIPSLFSNYATIVDNAKKVGATVQFSLKEAITGVSLADNVLKVDNTYSNPDSKDIVVVAKVIAKNAAGADIELVTSKETTFTLADLSGEWTGPSASTVRLVVIIWILLLHLQQELYGKLLIKRQCGKQVRKQQLVANGEQLHWIYSDL